MADRGPAFQVDGARQMRAALKRAGVSVQDLKDAHRAAADVVLASARPAAPARSGALAASGRAAGTQGAALVRFGGARVPYAGPIHWGWPSRHIKAQPFAADAAERTQPTWEASYLAALDQIIQTIEGDPTA